MPDSLLQNMPGFLAYIDVDKKYQFINRAGMDLLGLVPQTDDSQSFKSLEHPDYKPLRAAVEKAFGGVNAVIDVNITSFVGGEDLHFYGTAQPDINEEGTVCGVYIVAQDVSRLKAVEEQLAQASRAKSDFLANMSHEIRTPMTGIIGLTNLLKKTELDETQAKYVGMIENSGSMLVRIINDILDFSKIESQKMTLNMDWFDLPARLEKIYEIFETQARDKGLNISFVGQENLPVRVRGDAHRLEQIINNLMGNAIKYTAQGSIRLSVKPLAGKGERAKDSSVAKSWLRLEVADTGRGIPQKDQDSLFEKFTRIRDHEMEDIQGTGLGLAIAKNLAEMMGGNIDFESREGKGSKFWIDIGFEILPESGSITQHDKMADDVAANIGSRSEGSLISQALSRQVHEHTLHPDRSDVRASIPKNKTPGDKKDSQRNSQNGRERFNGHVLLVEDVETNRMIVRDILESHGLTVDEAANGKIAVEKALSGIYDLIFMDIRMPVMDGITATQKILKEQKKQKETAQPYFETPIIALTAYAMGEQMQECLLAGMSDFVTKPLQEEDLIMILREWLGGHDPLVAVANQEKQQARWEKIKICGGSEYTEDSNINMADKEPGFEQADIDMAFMDMIYQSDPARAKEIAQATLKDIEANKAPLFRCIEAGRLKEAEKLAHAMKSLCAQAGGGRLARITGEVEELCAQSQIPQNELAEQMEEAFGQFQGALDKYL